MSDPLGTTAWPRSAKKSTKRCLASAAGMKGMAAPSPPEVRSGMAKE
jgi:hypothetical protein